MRLPDIHAIVTAAAVVGYVITNAWVSLTQYPVYNILTWRTPFSAGLVIGVVAYVALAYFAASLVAWLRDRLAGNGLFRDEGGEVYRGPCACCCCCRGSRAAAAAAAAAPPPPAQLVLQVPAEGKPEAAQSI